MSPFIVGEVGDVHAGYTSIQTAITAALAAGNGNNVLVKPGTYTENLSISTGTVSVIALDASMTGVNNSLGAPPPKNVVLAGNVTVTGGTLKMSGIQITSSSAPFFAVAAGTLYLSYCSNSGTPAQNVFTLTTNGTKNINMNNCSFDVTSAFIIHDSSASYTVNIQDFGSVIQAPTTTTLFPAGASASVVWYSNYCSYAFDVSASTSIFGWNLDYCNMTVDSGVSFFTSGASTTGNLQATYTSFTGNIPPQNFITVGNANLVLTFCYCRFDNPYLYSLANGQKQLGGIFYTRPNPGVSTFTTGGVIVNTEKAGFQGSFYVTNQGFVQTTNATPTIIASIVVAAGQSITVEGIITAAQSDWSNAVGGNYILTATRTVAGNVTLVGSLVKNVNSSSAATYTGSVNVGTQTVDIIVTGVDSTVYNWGTTIKWMYMNNQN